MELPINTVFCCDDVYADKLAVAAYSLLRNTSSNVALYVVDCGISQKNEQLIQKLRLKCSNLIDVQFKSPERIACFEDFPVDPYFSSAIFYRLAIPQIFPSLKRAIYLDCDVIVDGDIAKLWETDLRGHPFSALNDEGNFLLSDDCIRRKIAAGIPENHIYMSSGALLIDSEKFEAAKILERVIAVIKAPHKKFACPEQDAMNICIRPDEYLPLDPRFNFTPFAQLATKRIKEGLVPVVIHYSCGKPWLFNRKLVAFFLRAKMYRYSLGFIKKYWEYSDELNEDGYAFRSVKPTLRFLYKRTFGPIEYFVAKKVRNGIVRFFKKLFCSKKGGES